MSGRRHRRYSNVDRVLDARAVQTGTYDPLKVGYLDGDDGKDDRGPHDRALVRAFNSHHKPSRDYSSDPERTLFVGRLALTTTENELRKHFERFGEIKSLYLIRDVLTGESRRYAFLEYRRSKDADRAYQEAHNTFLGGRRILVDRECGRTMKDWKSRRLGGGFGGSKQSGQMRFGGRTQSASTHFRSTSHHATSRKHGIDNDHYQRSQRTSPRQSTGASLKGPSTFPRFRR